MNLDIKMKTRNIIEIIRLKLAILKFYIQYR